tara:strand:- start:1215 stop:1619 length:405 start_codon:yes stop_codon:yes gene_type:complete
MIENTLSIIKPDAVERNLEENIKNIFIKNNLTIKDSKKIHISKDEASEFYKVHQAKPFYDDLCSYLSSGPIIVMILEGENAVKKNREIMGATNPKEAKPNTIRKLYGISIDKNSVHGSDSLENAKQEINFFFKD